MAKSLQEQLLGAGLVDQKKAKALKQEKRKQTKQQPKTKGGVVVNEDKVRIEQERQAKADRDRELNRKKQAELNERAVQAQIQQLIESNKVPVDGELGYQFVDDKKVRKIYVDELGQTQLASGVLAIAKHQDKFFVIPKLVAEKIMQRDPQVIVSLNEKSANLVDDDDPYKDYQIPDDLMW